MAVSNKTITSELQALITSAAELRKVFAQTSAQVDARGEDPGENLRQIAEAGLRQRDGSLVADDEEPAAQWSLSALAQAAKEAGISGKRSQIRRILLREGVRWRGIHSWGEPREKDFASKEPRSSATT